MDVSIKTESGVAASKKLKRFEIKFVTLGVITLGARGCFFFA